MAEAKDIYWISVPFTAGIAAGTVLFPDASGLPYSLPFFLLLIIIVLTALVILAACRQRQRFLAASPSYGAYNQSSCEASSPDGNDAILLRLIPDSCSLYHCAFAIIFIITGLFCSLNYSLAAGTPELRTGFFKSAAMNAVAVLREGIDAIAYPTESTGPLVKALLTGDRSDLTRELTGIFRDSGASHLLALSGLHLGIIYAILLKITAIMGNGRRAKVARSLLIIFLSLFYSVMTGAGPSIIRSFLFILLNEISALTGRRRNPMGVLLAALTIQLAISPEAIKSLGFQLSYLAMMGIFILNPPLSRLYPEPEKYSRLSRLDPMRRIWNAAVLSISCQVFTGPLVWIKFGTFPKYFIITNLIAIPITSAVMAFSVATIALSFMGICPDLLVRANDALIQALIFCLEVIAGMD